MPSKCRFPKPTDCIGQVYDERPPIEINCCAGCYPCLYICNENLAYDDDWELLINGTYIGDFNSTNNPDATIILPAFMNGKTINGAGAFGCANPAYYTWIYTTELDAIESEYSFTMRLQNIRGNNNFGTIKAICARLEIDDTVTLVNVGGSFTYENPVPYVVGAKLRYRLKYNT
jgi:hypothetical protein